MKITFANVEDFCAELWHAPIWSKQVRFRIDAEPEQAEQISFKIALWLTAVAQTPDGEYLMEYADFCGSDDPDSDPKDAGTQEAKRRIEQVASVAKDCGLTMLPGKIEQF